jgi:hypothetical protein
MTMSTKEMRELDAWIVEHLPLGFIHTEDPDAFTKSGEPQWWIFPPDGVVVSKTYSMQREGLFGHEWRTFEPTTDPADALLVLSKMRGEAHISIALGKRIHILALRGVSWEPLIDTDAPFEAAICLAAKALYSK